MNTSSVIKKMFLYIIKKIQKIIYNTKWEKYNKQTLKIELIIFTVTLSISKKFRSNLLKIDKKSYKSINICNIGYITIKKIDDCENAYSVNLLYLSINHANGYIKEKGVNNSLVFDSTEENKELLKKYNYV